jgi:hypothetical protein
MYVGIILLVRCGSCSVGLWVGEFVGGRAGAEESAERQILFLEFLFEEFV